MTAITTPRVLTFVSLAALSLGIAAGCSDDAADVSPPVATADPGTGGMTSGGGGEAPNADAPSLASSTPADGEAGVMSDLDAIVLEFDRAMDVTATSAAYSSTELPLEAVELSWSADATTLTITPDEPLDHAEGGVEVEALSYTIAFGEGAADADGNPLPAGTGITFTTARLIRMVVPRVDDLSVSFTGDSAYGGDTFWVGDQQIFNNVAGQRRKSLVGFSLAGVEPVVLEAALLRMPLAKQVGDPSDGLGGLWAQQTFHQDASFAESNVEPMSAAPVTVAVEGEVPVYEADVTDMVLDDLANRDVREDRTRFRVQYEMASNEDGDSDALELSTIQLELILFVE